MSEPEGVEGIIRTAIAERRLVEFSLQGLRRIAELHLYGTYRGARQLLVYQVGGESKSGKLPDWRRVDVAQLSELQLLEDRFPGPRLPADRHQQWDLVLARVG